MLSPSRNAACHQGLLRLLKALAWHPHSFSSHTPHFTSEYASDMPPSCVLPGTVYRDSASGLSWFPWLWLGSDLIPRWDLEGLEHPPSEPLAPGSRSRRWLSLGCLARRCRRSSLGVPSLVIVLLVLDCFFPPAAYRTSTDGYQGPMRGEYASKRHFEGNTLPQWKGIELGKEKLSGRNGLWYEIYGMEKYFYFK